MQNKHKKLKPGLVTSYDVWPGHGEGLFFYWCFINVSLTYLLTHLLTGQSLMHLPVENWLQKSERPHITEVGIEHQAS